MLNQSDVVRLLLRDRIKIQSYVDSFLNDAHLAEDCFQETCAAAVAKDLAFEDETHLSIRVIVVGGIKIWVIARGIEISFSQKRSLPLSRQLCRNWN